VVHLVWAPLGPRPLERFLAAYRRREPGSPHRLLIIFNGFTEEVDRSPWTRLLAGVEHEPLQLERPLLDLAAYREAVTRVAVARYCFLNSYSVVLADGWLHSLERALARPDTGLVAASGSWGSIRSYQRFMLGLGGPYASVFGDRRRTNAALAAVAADDAVAAEGAEPRGRRRRQPLRYLRALAGQSYGFVPFPAEHVRTNGFMIERAVFERLRLPSLAGKSDAYRLESGRDSFTAQVRRLGLEARVVGRDARAYAPGDWPASGTFWQQEQQNLLIADNQTRRYELSDAYTRSVLARYAWGALGDSDGAAGGGEAPGQAAL
jgi:hypothetical protein